MSDIIINGRSLSLPLRNLFYDEVLMLAFGPAQDQGVATITYRGPKGMPMGSMLPGDRVPIKNGMVFSCVRTDKA